MRPVAGRWFLYELFYRRHPTEGRVWVAMDGKEVCDVTGRTMTKARLGGVSLMKCYPTKGLYKGDRGTVEQWIDDLQIAHIGNGQASGRAHHEQRHDGAKLSPHVFMMPTARAHCQREHRR